MSTNKNYKRFINQEPAPDSSLTQEEKDILELRRLTAKIVKILERNNKSIDIDILQNVREDESNIYDHLLISREWEDAASVDNPRVLTQNTFYNFEINTSDINTGEGLSFKSQVCLKRRILKYE